MIRLVRSDSGHEVGNATNLRGKWDRKPVREGGQHPGAESVVIQTHEVMFQRLEGIEKSCAHYGMPVVATMTRRLSETAATYATPVSTSSTTLLAESMLVES